MHILLLLIPALFALMNAQSHAQNLPEIRLGVVAPLSGDFASYGTQIRAGVDLAAQALEIENPKQKIKIFYEDACLPAQAVSAANKLAAVDRIHAVVGSYCIIGMSAMAPIFAAHGILAFHSSPTADEVLRKGVLTTNVSVRAEAKRAAEFAYQTGARTAVVMFVTSQWGQEYSDFFKQRFEELGGKILLSIDSLIGTNDFKAELIKVKAARPQVVFLAHVGGMLGNLLKQAKQLGLETRLIGVDEAEESVVLEVAQGAAQGLTFFSPTPKQKNLNIEQFERTYKAQEGRLPGTLAANAYDATMIAAQALGHCKLSMECAKKQVLKISNYSGVSGVFSIREQEGTIRDFVRKEVRHGQFELVD